MRDGQGFSSIAAAQTVNTQTSRLTGHLKAEDVFPLRPTRVELDDTSVSCSQQNKGVVLQTLPSRRGRSLRAPWLAMWQEAQVPKERACERKGFCEIPHEPVAQVEDVNALIQEFPAAGQRRVGPPFFVIA